MTWFSCIGADNDCVIYETPSRSDPKRVHTITLNRRDGFAHCTCEEAWYLKRAYADILDPKGLDCCWHLRVFVETVGKIIKVNT